MSCTSHLGNYSSSCLLQLNRLFFKSCIIRASGSLACPVQKIILSAVLAWLFNFFQGMFPKTQLLLNCFAQETVSLGQGSTASHGPGCGKGWVLIISVKIDTFPSLSNIASNFSKRFFVCLLAFRQDSNIAKSFSGAVWAEGHTCTGTPLVAVAKMSRRKLSKNQVLMSYIDMLCKKGCCCPHHLPKQDGSCWWLSAWSPG